MVSSSQRKQRHSRKGTPVEQGKQETEIGVRGKDKIAQRNGRWRRYRRERKFRKTGKCRTYFCGVKE